jgi:hypothetical protein
MIGSTWRCSSVVMMAQVDLRTLEQLAVILGNEVGADFFRNVQAATAARSLPSGQGRDR